MTGAADIPVELIRRVDDELPFSLIITGYGLTEAGTAAATSPEDDVETIATTVGRPRPGFELRIVDGQGQTCRPGRPARSCSGAGASCPTTSTIPEATAEALSPDGWLRTGDLGVVDPSGCLRIVGRSKDMFIVGGFNAYPAEIENALLRHPDIRQVAVIGIPDERLGEVGMAFAVVAPGCPGHRTGHHRVVPRPDGQLQGAPGGGARRRAPAQRHRQGHEGSPAGAGRPGPLRGPAHDRSDASRPLVAGRPPGGRARGVGGRPVGRRPAGRLGGRRHQGGGPRPAIPCATSSAPSASPATCPTRPSPSTTGASAAWSSTCASRTERQHLEDLLATADVFISNLRPDALDKLDLEPEATVGRHPRLVYCSISGYGLTGRGPEPPHLRHRRLLGPFGPVHADGRRRRQPAQRPRWHR